MEVLFSTCDAFGPSMRVLNQSIRKEMMMSTLKNDDPNRRVRMPVGGNGKGGVRTEAYVSSVNGGEHLNIFPTDAQSEKAKYWRNGAQIECQFKDDRPDFISFQKSEQAGGRDMREKKPGGQRARFVLKTAHFGKIDRSIKPVAVESWDEGDGFCVRVAQLFANAENQS
jgi:hypothetical protein